MEKLHSCGCVFARMSNPPPPPPPQFAFFKVSYDASASFVTRNVHGCRVTLFHYVKRQYSGWGPQQPYLSP